MFDTDPYPGKPKILFIAFGGSSHTHAWIDLIKDEEFNVRLFSMPGMGDPPLDWRVRTYISEPVFLSGKERKFRKTLFPFIKLKQLPQKYDHYIRTIIQILFKSRKQRWLAQIVREWQPHIIHTLGIFNGQGGEYYYQVRKAYKLEGIGKWVVTLRGGSDLTLNRHDPEKVPIIKNILWECDEIISDNVVNIDYAEELGIPRSKFAPITPVPGTGGVDVEVLRNRWNKLPSQRERIILYPKAYDYEWSLALPVFEALKLCWDEIKPCKIHMLSMFTPTTKQWYLSLPKDIRDSSIVYNRIPREEVINLMLRSRIMLAPSLVDGIPNSLYEAMACGMFPIVSPLDTITTVVEKERNVLFARNLYPQEIANALVRAMNDDFLVDHAVNNNLELINKVANRNIIKKKVVNYYNNLAEIIYPKK